MNRLEVTRALERYEQRRLSREAAVLALRTAEAEVERRTDLQATAEQVKTFFSVLAEAQRQELQQKVEALVDYGVQQVFGPTHRFKVVSELRGKSVRTEFFLVENGVQLSLVDGAGGGIGDVVSFLLRIVMLCLVRPAQRRVLVLDEPFKFVSTGHFQTLTTLLRELTESLDLQLIMVTHKPELLDAATTIVRVEKAGDQSRATVQTP